METLLSQTKLLQSIEKQQNELKELGICMNGTLCQRSGKCTNPKCECHQGVRKHLSWQLTQTERGKTHTIYVPVEMVDEVREWTENHRKAKEIMKEMSTLCEKYIRSVVPKLRAGIRRKQTLTEAVQEKSNEQ